MGAAVFHSNHFYKSKQQAEFDQRVPVLVQCLSNCTRGVISNQFCGMLPILFVCVCVCACVCTLSHFSCVWFLVTLWTVCSPPGSSVHEILQARILEWIAMPFSRGSSWPRGRTHISYVSCIGRWVLYHEHHSVSAYTPYRERVCISLKSACKTHFFL